MVYEEIYRRQKAGWITGKFTFPVINNTELDKAKKERDEAVRLRDEAIEETVGQKLGVNPKAQERRGRSAHMANLYKCKNCNTFFLNCRRNSIS